MKQETVTSGRTVEAALDAAAKYFNVPKDKIVYEILAEPKKGFLGFGEAPAKIRATYEQSPADLGLAFVEKLIENMGIHATVSMSDTESGKLIKVYGNEATSLIGHHGETLDQLQYLVNLAANKKETPEDDREYTRIVVDIEDYRAKREQTLRGLARRMSAKVLRTGRSVSLEPMSAYERRIIHSEVHDIEGVTTISVGNENTRRVVIHLDESYSAAPERTSDEGEEE